MGLRGRFGHFNEIESVLFCNLKVLWDCLSLFMLLEGYFCSLINFGQDLGNFNEFGDGILSIYGISGAILLF